MTSILFLTGVRVLSLPYVQDCFGIQSDSQIVKLGSGKTVCFLWNMNKILRYYLHG